MNNKIKFCLIIIGIIVTIVIISCYFNFTCSKQGFKRDENYCKKVPIEKLHTKLYEMMAIAHKKLTEANIPYTIAYGTLLGVIRDKQIIKHDDDIDIIVYLEEDDRTELVKVLKTLELNGEYEIIDAGFGLKILDNNTHQHTCDNGVQLDIFIFKKESINSNIWRGIDGSGEEHIKIDSSDIFPIKLGKLKDVTVNMPNNPKATLDIMYRENWMIPKVYNHSRANFE